MNPENSGEESYCCGIDGDSAGLGGGVDLLAGMDVSSSPSEFGEALAKDSDIPGVESESLESAHDEDLTTRGSGGYMEQRTGSRLRIYNNSEAGWRRRFILRPEQS